MNVQSLTLGGLSCQVVDALPEGQDPQLVVVFCHGYGAPATDLVPLGPELIDLNADLGPVLQFIFPAAPLSLDELGLYGGRAWWQLDVARLTAAIERGESRILRDACPKGLEESRKMLNVLVEEVQQQTGLPTSKIVLGGFSQGAMLAIDVALRLPEPPGGLCIYSGTLLCEEIWRELAAKRGRLPVLQSHGHQDPILPFQAAEWLRDLLREAEMDVDFVPFQGVHVIPFEAIHKFAAMLGRIANG